MISSKSKTPLEYRPGGPRFVFKTWAQAASLLLAQKTHTTKYFARARRIAKGIPRSTVLLMKQIARVRQILARASQLFLHMMKLGQSLGRYPAGS
jgi:hypothetical protein